METTRCRKRPRWYDRIEEESENEIEEDQRVHLVSHIIQCESKSESEPESESEGDSSNSEEEMDNTLQDVPSVEEEDFHHSPDVNDVDELVENSQNIVDHYRTMWFLRFCLVSTIAIPVIAAGLLGSSDILVRYFTFV